MSSSPVSARLQEFYRESFVWDAHAGIFPDPKVNLSVLEDWRSNGVNYLSVNVGFDVMDPAHVMATLAAYRRYVLAHNDRLILAGRLVDIAHARDEDKLAVSFDIEGMKALSGDLDMVDVYHALGVRQMLFAYNLNNVAAGGCHDNDSGLTEFGRAIVRRMNDLGIIVDCSHVGYRTSMDIISESSKPVVFSHSNPTVIWAHERNITDDQIKACARTGGAVGINGMGIFLGENDTRTETMLRHVCHVAELVGTEHIGFGLDFTPQIDVDVTEILASRPDYWPAGNLYDTPGIGHAGPPQLLDMVNALADRGFSEPEIRGMLGENFLRVASQVWKNS